MGNLRFFLTPKSVPEKREIFLFNFFKIFFDRQLGILCEQPCGQTRGGAIPKSVSETWPKASLGMLDYGSKNHLSKNSGKQVIL